MNLRLRVIAQAVECREQQLAAAHPLTGVGNIDGMRPPYFAVEAILSRDDTASREDFHCQRLAHRHHSVYLASRDIRRHWQTRLKCRISCALHLPQGALRLVHVPGSWDLNTEARVGIRELAPGGFVHWRLP